MDFVLAYDSSKVEHNKKRNVFEENLMKEGLHIEKDEFENFQIHFVKIHVPLYVLKRYSELLKFKIPLKNVRTHTYSSFEKHFQNHTLLCEFNRQKQDL